MNGKPLHKPPVHYDTITCLHLCNV